MFGENVSNTLQDIVLTMFRYAHTDGRTHGRTGRQNHYASGHTMLGGGIKSEKMTRQVIEIADRRSVRQLSLAESKVRDPYNAVNLCDMTGYGKRNQNKTVRRNSFGEQGDTSLR